jgi:serine protease inhibitor
MYVFLPDNGSTPEKLLGIMSGDTWQRVTEPGFSDREGTVVLPRFKLEYSVDMVRPLKALGAKSAFGKADFLGISNRPLFISAVRQSTFVEVNEEGTEAAAATSMTIASGGCMPVKSADSRICFPPPVAFFSPYPLISASR